MMPKRVNHSGAPNLPLPVLRGRAGVAFSSRMASFAETPTLTLPRSTGRGDNMRSLRIPRPGFRRGSVYVLVLGTSMLIMLIGLATVAMTQANARSGSQSGDVIEASALAESGVELALTKFSADSNWQIDYPAGVATTPVALGRGTVSFKWLSVATGGVRIYGIGQVHNAKRIYSIAATTNQPVATLKSATFAGTSISLPTLGTVSGGGTITTNGSIGGLLVNFTVPTIVQAVSNTLGILTNLTNALLGSPPTPPSNTHVFDYYTTNGTDITSSVPTSGGNYKLQYVLLAPNINTLSGGAKNSQGIYVINCNNTVINISNCRVYGTLVLLNPGTNSSINGSVYFAPAAPGYPCLMVKGNFALSAGTANLSDSSAQSINFNQTGAPYQGATDATFTTSYPCRFEGVVYVSGNLNATAATIIGSLQVGGTLSVSTSISETYDPTVYNIPAPGFSSSQLTTTPGSWQWETGP
jgi:hypothetical protein